MLNTKLREYFASQNMSEAALTAHYNRNATDIDEYVFGGDKLDHFKFDASSFVSWRNALRLVEIPLVPISQPLIVENIHNRKAMKTVNKQFQQILTKFNGFVREDHSITAETFDQIIKRHPRPGMKRFGLTYSRININEEMEYLHREYSTTKKHIFYVEDLDYDSQIFLVNVFNGKVIRPDGGYTEQRHEQAAKFAEHAVTKLREKGIKPCHPQLNEFAIPPYTFYMIVVASNKYMQELAVFDAGLNIPEDVVNLYIQKMEAKNASETIDKE